MYTTNKPVSEMSMTELAYNACYVKDGEARYRDYTMDIDAREMAGKIGKLLGFCDLESASESFDEEMAEYAAFNPCITKEGLLALIYRLLWTCADLRQRLAAYEDTGLSPEQIVKMDELYAEKCKELEAEKRKHRWIPVSERLPENTDDVIVTQWDGTVCAAWYSESIGVWLDQEDDAIDALAWMPMPEAYRKEAS